MLEESGSRKKAASAACIFTKITYTETVGPLNGRQAIFSWEVSFMNIWRGYEHGINFGGWLSQCQYTKEHFDSFITEQDFKTVRSWGLDHIRIPVDYNLFENADGSFSEDGLKYIDFAVAQCRRNGLNMILDLHKTPGFSFDSFHNELGFFDNPAYQEHFYDIWTMFAKRFGGNSDMLAFELLNEVTKKEYNETWKRVARTCIERIRTVAKDITILVGGYYNNSLEAVRDLAEPYDEHIVYNFHCYEPLLFTHQGAPWIIGMDTSFRCPFEMTYREYTEGSKRCLGQSFVPFDRFGSPEEVPDCRFFETLMADALAVSEERKVPLYCGEYGVIDRVAPEEALKWYKAFHAALDRHGIGSAAWSYRRMDFGISDELMNSVRNELLSVIRGEQSQK